MGDAKSVHQKLEFRTDKAIFGGLPVALFLALLGLSVFALDERRSFEHTLAGWILVIVGVGWCLFALWRRARPGKPLYVLAPQGIRLRIPWIKEVLIPWREVCGMDAVTIDGPRRTVFPDVTVVEVSKSFYDKHLHVKSLLMRGPGWRANFNPRGDVVQVALHHEMVGADAAELYAAVEARWHAFGDRSFFASERRTPEIAGRSAKVPSSDNNFIAIWEFAKYALPLIGIAVVLSNLLGFWATDKQRSERRESQKWQEWQARHDEETRKLDEARRKQDAEFKEAFRRLDEQTAKTEQFWKEFEQQVTRTPGKRDDGSTTEQPTQAGGHREAVLSIDVAPDGRHFLTASGDRTIKLWEVAKPEAVRTIATHPGIARTVRYAADGRTAVSASDGGDILVHDLATGGEPRRLDAGQYGDISALAVSVDGRRAVTVHDKGGAVLVWNLPPGTHRDIASGDRMRQQAVAIAPDGKRAVTGGTDGKPRLWDLDAGGLLRIFGEHKGPVYSVVITPDGAKAITGGGDSSMRMWDLASGQQVRQFSGHINTVYSIALSPDGKHVLSGSLDATARLWEIETGRDVTRFAGHQGGIYSVAMAPDGSVLTGSRDRTIRLWTPRGGTVRVYPGAGE